ncbi:MAG TPA: DNA-3-methyladenine glycosylase 2 family protein [Miltoncostaeaceae bacterium]|nr:DNA-3-methyladenine glycosylase 2 family protein [Miltoncostaeaceae bacterium]
MTPEESLRRADPVLGGVMDEVPPVAMDAWRARWAPGDRFGLLARVIVGQQISARAAAAIFARLRDLMGHEAPAAAVAAAGDEELRAVGLSRNKTASLRDLAERTLDGRLELDRLDELPDDEVVSQLVAVRGIGPWTADLFLLGALGRRDVLPAGDLRLRSVVRAAYGLEATPTEGEVRELGERWRPHRSLATAYLYSWRRDSSGAGPGTSTP